MRRLAACASDLRLPFCRAATGPSNQACRGLAGTSMPEPTPVDCVVIGAGEEQITRSWQNFELWLCMTLMRFLLLHGMIRKTRCRHAPHVRPLHAPIWMPAPMHAGVVGLACARALAFLHQEVVILEQAASFGTETSSRHSEGGMWWAAHAVLTVLCAGGQLDAPPPAPLTAAHTS